MLENHKKKKKKSCNVLECLFYKKKVKIRSKGTQINFKNNLTTPLFKIRVVQ